MPTIGERIRSEREAAGLKKRELGRLVGMTGAGIGQIESGATKSPKPENLIKMADALGVSIRWLTTGRGHRHVVREGDAPEYRTDPRALGKVPLISWVQAGSAELAIDNFSPGDAEDWLFCNTSHSPKTYALRVKGDSMTSPYGRSYPDGCIIFVDPEQRGGITTGDPIIAKIDGEDAVTFKTLTRDDHRVFLKPLNDRYPLIEREFRVLGKVIEKLERGI